MARAAAAASAAPARKSRRRASWANGAADFVHDPGIALYEDLWPDARATGDGLGRAARMGGEEPARHLETPITVEDVLNSRMIAYPFRLLQCCLVTDGGGASTRKLPYSHSMWASETRQSA
jgi:hypothetical protein